jgi:hypothetical protein
VRGCEGATVLAQGDEMRSDSGALSPLKRLKLFEPVLCTLAPWHLGTLAPWHVGTLAP